MYELSGEKAYIQFTIEARSVFLYSLLFALEKTFNTDRQVGKVLKYDPLVLPHFCLEVGEPSYLDEM